MIAIVPPNLAKRLSRTVGMTFILVGLLVAAVGFTRQDCQAFKVQVAVYFFSLLFWGMILLIAGMMPACDDLIASLFLMNSNDDDKADVDSDDFD